MKEFDAERVLFYGRNDLAAGWFRTRIVELLTSPDGTRVESINDAIEAFQCKATIEELPELFEGTDFDSLKASSRLFFSNACRFINQTIEVTNIGELFEEVEAQYCHLFWLFLDKSGASKKLQNGDLEHLINKHPECIIDILEVNSIVKAHGQETRRALLSNPRISAELIIRRLATPSSSERNLALPAELTNDDLDTIMCNYLNGDNPNPNHVRVLSSWPSSQVSRYKPSPDTIVLAKKVSETCTKELFANGSGFRFGVGVRIDERQVACKGILVDGFDTTHVFGEKWLRLYLDYPTIMNNCIYVFDYVDARGIMTMPSHAHDETALIESLGIRVLGEYKTTNAFFIRNALALTETIAYAQFLKQHGTRLESALEWVYNHYFEDEFGIKGFSLSLPSEESSWLDKCKSIGPEIERAAKAYTIYAKRGQIDDAYFPFESISSFLEPPSLNGDKYIVAGEKLEAYGFHLFSDQSPLAYIEDKSPENRSFFDILLNQGVSRTSYHSNLQSTIDWLLQVGLITEEVETGILAPTLQSRLLKIVWETGVIPLKYCSTEENGLLDDLVAEGTLSRGNTLFTPDEAAYLSYVFNDRSFPNSLGLRNRYDHASSAVRDPNSDSMKNDYYQMLTILIAITIKINEELQDRTGAGGPSIFVDWPMFDESVLQTAIQLRLLKSTPEDELFRIESTDS